MAVDESLISNFKDGDLPIFRLYRWESSLTFGRFSKPSLSVDLEILKEKNISYTRRMTGGGILVHGGDLSYSLILPREYLNDLGVKESYHYLCRFLINFYERLGVSADFAHNHGLNISKSDICMCANEPYDIIIDGKKIGGNAQRYTKDVLLQHGSIPINFNDAIFKDIFLEETSLENINTLDKIIQDIRDIELIKLLVESFSQSFDITFDNDTLSPLEQQNAEMLLTHKYSTKRWNIDAKT